MQTLWISIVGVLAVTIYAALAAVQILVLNPLAAAPGRSLDEIHAEMSNAGESLMPGQAFFILGVGIALAVALAVVAVCTAAHPLIPAMGFLVLLMLGAGVTSSPRSAPAWDSPTPSASAGATTRHGHAPSMP